MDAIQFPRCSNQPLASSAVIAARASVMAASRALPVRAAILRKMALSFDQHSSIGFISGEDGGRYSRRAPAASMSSRDDLAHPAHLVRWQVVHHYYLAGSELLGRV